jgi:hypothetical protein
MLKYAESFLQCSGIYQTTFWGFCQRVAKGNCCVKGERFVAEFLKATKQP